MSERECERRALGIMAAACDLDKGQRSGFLANACGDDQALRARVEALLAADNFPGEPLLRVEGTAKSAARRLARALEGKDGPAPRATGTWRPPRSGRYRIEGEIGRGAMGVVYRAHDVRLDRAVAIKVLPAELCRDKGRLERIEREARILASLNHPGIATVHALEEADGARLLVLELIDGETLAERLRRGAMSVEEALDAGQQIAVALDAAHARGVLHRDLKPHNVMLTADGRLKVLDFGLAKCAVATPVATAADKSYPISASALLGTPGYMSPERTRGEGVDRRADVWAFGCVLFATLTAREAFAGRTVWEKISATLSREPSWDLLPEETPKGVVELIERCLEKDPQRRLGSAAELRRELERALSRLPRRKAPA